MKHLTILMVFLLVVMLLFSGVLAVGNARQSVQIADRVQQLSSLKAELRSVQKENRQLIKELETAQAGSRKLRWQQQAVAKQLAGVLAVAGNKPPVLPQPAGDTADGELLLQAMAVKQTLTAAQAAWGGLRKKVEALHGEAAADGRICWAAVSGGENAAAASVDRVEGIAGNPVWAAGAAPGAGIAAAGGVAGDEAAGDGGHSAGGTVDGTCCGRDGCCCVAERLTGHGTVLAISEAVTVPVCSGESGAAEAAARLMPLLQRQAEQMGDVLRSLFELATMLAQSIGGMPVGGGV